MAENSKIDYQIGKFAQNGTFTREQLLQILNVLPISVEIAEGHELLLEARIEDSPCKPTLVVDYSGAQIISLRPPEGMRLQGASMFGSLASKFNASRIMDECTGGGACCSYFSNTLDLGLPFNVDFGFDIYKLG